MIIKISGKITDIFPGEIFGTNFESRRFCVVEQNGERYPNTYEIQAQQGDCNTLDKFLPGDIVDVKADLRGRTWSKNGKAGVINTIKMLEIIRIGGPAKFVPSTRNQTGGIPPKESPSGHPDKWQAPKQTKLDDEDPF